MKRLIFYHDADQYKQAVTFVRHKYPRLENGGILFNSILAKVYREVFMLHTNHGNLQDIKAMKKRILPGGKTQKAPIFNPLPIYRYVLAFAQKPPQESDRHLFSPTMIYETAFYEGMINSDYYVEFYSIWSTNEHHKVETEVRINDLFRAKIIDREKIEQA